VDAVDALVGARVVEVRRTLNVAIAGTKARPCRRCRTRSCFPKVV
jgi:hypothetical protein